MKKQQKIDPLSYKGKSFTERKASFKPLFVESKRILLDYQKVEKDFTSALKGQLTTILINNPDMFNGIETSDIENLSKKYLTRIYDLAKTNPDFLTITNQIADAIKTSSELFLLTEDNAKKITDILFEDCDIDHSDESLNSLSKDEFKEYLNFLMNCFSFFLNQYQK